MSQATAPDQPVTVTFVVEVTSSDTSIRESVSEDDFEYAGREGALAMIIAEVLQADHRIGNVDVQVKE